MRYRSGVKRRIIAVTQLCVLMLCVSVLAALMLLSLASLVLLGPP